MKEVVVAANYLGVERSVGSLPKVLASRLLKEHLRNLIVNAVQAVDAKHVDGRPSYPSIVVSGQVLRYHSGSDEAALPKQRVRLTIRDAGIGIAEHELPMVVQHGYSIKASFGFGLAGAIDYVRSVGGSVSVTSEYGEWTSVAIDLMPAGSGAIA